MMYYCCKIVLLVSILFVPLTSSTIIKDNFESVKNGIIEYLQTGHKSDSFLEALETYQLPDLRHNDNEMMYYDDDQICTLCTIGVDWLIRVRKVDNASAEQIVDTFTFLCTALGIESERVCSGFLDRNINIFVYIIDNKDDLSTQRFCGSIFQSYNCEQGDNFEWAVDIPSGSSPERPEPNDTATESLNILHLSDIHYDPLYKPYGNADCGEPTCCGDDQGEPSTNETTCGYWTDYRHADVPWHLIEQAIAQTKTQPFEYVYYTGDIISHRVWSTTILNNTNDITRIYEYFHDNFEVPVYPVFGNHEPHPLNNWSSESVENNSTVSTKWLFELAYDLWSKWLPADDTTIKDTILRGGYYTVSPRPGFRIIALNNNVCYVINWWLIFDDVDPFGQLKWLAETLQQAEVNNESVHILSHVPSGSSSCLKVWSREYRKIVERFANTITGQFNGHTHKDEFYVFYNSSEYTRPINAAFNGASITPYSNSNPSYKIYQINTEMYTVLDYEEWTFNLTLANLQPDEPPEWYMLYKFTEAYGVENLRPEQLGNVLVRMAENHTLIDQFFIYKYRNGDSGISGGCSISCQRVNLCTLATSQTGDSTQCNYLLEIYDQYQE